VHITQENIDTLNAIVKVEIATEDYMPGVEEAVKQNRKNIVIKGFRKGQVPPSLIKKMYGTGILLDVINKLVSEATEKYFTENKINLLGRPMQKNAVADLDIHHPVNYTLEYEIGITPAFSIPAFDQKTKVTEYVVRVDDATVNKELENLRQRYGISVNIDEPVIEKDVIYLQLDELDGANIKEGGVSAYTPVSTDLFKKDTAFYKSLLGKKPGDAMDVDLFDIIDKDRDAVIKHILELKEGAPEGMGDRFRLVIDKVSRNKPAELNQEFLEKVFGPGRATNEEEAKEKLREELSAYFTRSSQDRLRRDIIDLLIHTSHIDLPDDFLKRWIRSSNDKPVTEEQIEKEYPMFASDLRWQLISNKIGLDNELKAEFEDIKAFSRNELRQQLAMYNPSGQPVEDQYLDMLNESMLSKEEHVKKSYEGAMEQKLFTFIKEHLDIEQKLVSLDEFLEK